MRDVALFLIFVALVGSVYYNQQMSKKLNDRDKILSQEEKRLARLEKEASHDRAQIEEELRSQENALKQYQNSFQNLQTNHDALSARLIQAKNLNTGGREVDSAKWDMGLQKKTVSELEAQIKEIEAQKKDYKSKVDSYIQDRKLNHDRNLALVNEQLGLQDLSIKQMNDQYNNLKQQKQDVTAQYDAKQLRPQIDGQRVNYEKLKAQRDSINLTWDSEKNDSTKKSAVAMNDYNSKENYLRDQLNHEKGTYGQIDERLKESSKSATDQRSEIAKIEQDLRNTDDAMKDTRKKIQDAQNQINELKAKLGKSAA